MLIREMTIEDYEEVFELWQITSKKALSKADEKEKIETYLNRNKGMSQVTIINNKIVGTVLAGDDGRRGFLYHQAVHPDHRKKGIGKKMVDKVKEKTKAKGIEKIWVFSYVENENAHVFWENYGFEKRDDFYVFTHVC